MGDCQDLEAALAGLPQLDEVLTPRQLKVADGIAAGFDNAQIALALGISYQTVKNHITRILAATGLASRGELMLVAVKQGRVDLDARVAAIAAEHMGCAERNRYDW